MAFKWTFSHPGATFADQLLEDGCYAGGKVCRYQRSAPLSEQAPGEPWKVSAPFYVGFIGVERLDGEYDTLREAQHAVELSGTAPRVNFDRDTQKYGR